MSVVSLEPSAALSISAVEQETGLSKDVLRVWERRYGFPCPQRNTYGERVYPDEQVLKLRLVRRLLDRGLRPGRLLPMSTEELGVLMDQSIGEATPLPVEHDLAMYLVKTHQTSELRRELSQAVVRDGLYRFVTQTCGPLLQLVGEAWMRGEIRVFEEHLFTEQVQAVLRGAIAQISGPAGTPRVLLSTLPGEQHGLGLLMAEAVFSLEGAECVSLGLQTPIGDLAAAALAKQADLLALSFSGNFPANQMLESLSLLRAALPPQIGLWCGGMGPERARRLPRGVFCLSGLQGIGPALEEWRDARSRATLTP
ncbi:MAG: MerR family transcriptional regulator [Betaproteobacteria bacterium]|nr:MerR family transcriptional regulator [Betaproteobacteria bacterium]